MRHTTKVKKQASAMGVGSGTEVISKLQLFTVGAPPPEPMSANNKFQVPETDSPASAEKLPADGL